MDFLVPIVFPDYLISTPVGKLPQLGHAGILIILGSTGSTRYYEYGRYDKAELGEIRKRLVPDVRIDRLTKKPETKSLAAVLKVISQKAGQNGHISGAYIEAPGVFSKADSYAQSRLNENGNSSRESYEILSNSCLHFMKLTLEAAGISTPWLVDPRPNSYIEELRSDYPDLDYSPKTNLVTIGP